MNYLAFKLLKPGVHSLCKSSKYKITFKDLCDRQKLIKQNYTCCKQRPQSGELLKFFNLFMNQKPTAK